MHKHSIVTTFVTTLAALSFGLGTSSMVQADATIAFAQDAQGTSDASTMYIKNDKLRIDAANSQNNYMIFDAAADTFTVVDTQRQTWMEISEEDLAAMGDMHSQVMAQMEKQLAQVPEAQRAQMREMIMAQMPQMQKPAEAPVRKIVRTGEQREVSGYACDVVKVTVDDADRAELCVAPRGALGLSSGDFSTLQEMQKLALSMAERFGQAGASMDFGDLSADEFPVAYQAMGNGGQQGVIEEVSTEALSADLFTIPDGYTRQEMPRMPQ